MYNIELLAKCCNRELFSCGIEALDRYLKQQANQDANKHVASIFVLVETGSFEVIGYYTLSSIAIDVDELPESLVKKLPKYPLLPATLLGRLAIDKRHHGKKLDELLIIDALRRSVRSSAEIAARAIIVAAKDERALSFYQHYGFIQFPRYKYKLFLSMATAVKLFGF